MTLLSKVVPANIYIKAGDGSCDLTYVPILFLIFSNHTNSEEKQRTFNFSEIERDRKKLVLC